MIIFGHFLTNFEVSNSLRPDLFYRYQSEVVCQVKVVQITDTLGRKTVYIIIFTSISLFNLNALLVEKKSVDFVLLVLKKCDDGRRGMGDKACPDKRDVIYERPLSVNHFHISLKNTGKK